MPYLQDIPETGVMQRSPRGSADVRVWYARGWETQGCIGRIIRALHPPSCWQLDG
jgi:hypothetical protein